VSSLLQLSYGGSTLAAAQLVWLVWFDSSGLRRDAMNFARWPLRSYTGLTALRLFGFRELLRGGD
jgi:hypothetical protein